MDIKALISAILTDAGYANIKIAKSVEAWRELDGADLPAVVIAPVGKPRIWWIRFNTRNVTQEVAVGLINGNDLATKPLVAVETFKTNMTKLFHCEVLHNSSFAGTGVWRSRVEDGADFDAGKWPRQWDVSTTRVKMDYVLEG